MLPTIDPKQATDEADLWASPWNYTSLTDDREEAESLGQKERAAGWLEWFPDEATAEAKYGQIDYSRIGVVAKWMDERLKLRLIHDRRSGANQKVNFEERLVLPRLTDLKDDLLWFIESVGHDLWECVLVGFQQRL